MAGNAIGQIQEGFEPVVADDGELFDIDPSGATADDGHEGDGEDVMKFMQVVVPAGIGDLVEHAQNLRGRLRIHAKLLE